MDIEDYLAKRMKLAKAHRNKIKDFKVFDFNYIPAKPIMREEIKPVIDAMVMYQKACLSHSALLVGSKGSGKTLMVKYLQRLFENKIGLTVKYANCRSNNTSFKIIAHLTNSRARGCSLSELWKRFEEMYPGKTVVILDEIDLISPKDRNKDILYLLSRSENNYMTIILSNNPKFLYELDAPTRSSLQPEIIYFKNYDALQMFEILKARATEGIRKLSAGILKKISALTVQNTNSDVRVAIKTLLYSVIESNKSTQENFENAQRDIVIDMINDLNDKNILALKATSADRKKFVKDVYKGYVKLSNLHKEKAFSYVHFYNNLSYLQSLGLILLVSTKVNRAYTYRISLLFDEQVLNSVYSMRFGR